jgi:hypothetical protein
MDIFVKCRLLTSSNSAVTNVSLPFSKNRSWANKTSNWHHSLLANAFDITRITLTAFFHIFNNIIYNWFPNLKISIMYAQLMFMFFLLKTLNLASNPYICDCCLIWFIKWLNNTNIVIQQYPVNYIQIAVSESDGTLVCDRTSVRSQGQKRNILSGSNVWLTN